MFPAERGKMHDLRHEEVAYDRADCGTTTFDSSHEGGNDKSDARVPTSSV